MTTQVRKASANTVRRPETGWARARRLRGREIRTWVRAMAADGDGGQPRGATQDNIVRGDD
ncbi:hypothetical protein [Streptomyces caeruleatus]|uniref:Uncharacterized protein n=1 Tax=Streptomyces caeruleatus TaxID=661399 RepID=A0A101U6X4_9ACTN|nr:hypothetical protein [Streptomyces caeruleatus]KUO05184.1 hypothetical protein AQJ67_07295 [Streptomyces caeruleatus]